MSNYELYEKVLEALNGDEGTFNAAARNWIEGADNVEFNNVVANDLFWTAKRYCAIWRSNAISSRISKIRMIECVRQLAEMGLPNPYQKEESKEIPEPADNTKEEVKPAEIIKEEPKEEIKKEEPKHILGVIPEEKPKLFNKRKNR